MHVVKTGEAERLQRSLDLVVPELVGATATFLAHPRIADLYPEFLFGCYCLARASVPLMETTRQTALSMAADDEVCAALAPYLEEHILEETGHDEWFLEDLGVLGMNRDAILSRPPSATLASAVGSQYYWALHYHPVAILGFLIALEGNPPSTELIDQLRKKTGHDPRAFRTLIEHAELDPHHGEELNRLLDELSLTRDQSTVVGLSALQTLHLEAVSLVEIIGSLPA
jgi:Iron-containing redox enzyme